MCVNNSRRTLNVKTENSLFPPIVLLAFAACFMHFIISGGVSKEGIGEGRPLLWMLTSTKERHFEKP